MGRTNSCVKGGANKGLEGLLYSKNNFAFSSNANTPNDVEVSLPYVQTSISQITADLPSTVTKVKIKGNNNITNMYRAFFRKNNITEITLDFDTSTVTFWDNCFSGYGYDSTLTKIANALDFTNLNTGNLFASCYSLVYLRIVQNTLSVSLALNQTNLDADSYTSVFNSLMDISSGTAQTLTLQNSHYGRYTDTQIAEATAKGWTVTRLN